MRQVVCISLLIYTVALPFMLWIHRGYRPRPWPSGRYVELISPLADPILKGSARFASIRGFDTPDEWGRLRLYENTTPLARDRYDVKPFEDPGRRHIKLRASDDTDPQYNGRTYFAVLQ